MTQVASFSGEVVLTSLAERFSICLAYASKVWKAFSPRKAMPPKELIQQYQEKRASLNADIDRILAQITDILGIDITEEGDE